MKSYLQPPKSYIVLAFVLYLLAGCATPPTPSTLPACEPQPGKIQQACSSPATGLSYWLYLPAQGSVPEGQKPPLIIYLHGFNHSGSELSKLLMGGLPLEIENKRALPAVIVSPQCPADDNWQIPGMVEKLSRFVDEMVQQYGADPRRVSLTGFSMGGDGVWALGIAHPEQFAALAPVSSWYTGGQEICGLKDVPVWVFQSDRDEVVGAQYAKNMVAALERCGGTVKLTMYNGFTHEGTRGQAYATDELYEWMLEQQRAE